MQLPPTCCVGLWCSELGTFELYTVQVPPGAAFRQPQISKVPNFLHCRTTVVVVVVVVVVIVVSLKTSRQFFFL